MVETAELTDQDMLRLPAGVAKRFRPADRFVIVQDGDNLYLKKITRPDVLKRVMESDEGDRMSLEEISAMVHEVRRRRREA
jgi:hypothetical protein